MFRKSLRADWAMSHRPIKISDQLSFPGLTLVSLGPWSKKPISGATTSSCQVAIVDMYLYGKERRQNYVCCSKPINMSLIVSNRIHFYQCWPHLELIMMLNCGHPSTRSRVLTRNLRTTWVDNILFSFFFFYFVFHDNISLAFITRILLSSPLYFQLKKRNAVMLEETKDTITVPAVFMIRMLACLNQIRRGSENLWQYNEGLY